jgi:hypothetical protein
MLLFFVRTILVLHVAELATCTHVISEEYFEDVTVKYTENGDKVVSHFRFQLLKSNGSANHVDIFPQNIIEMVKLIFASFYHLCSISLEFLSN